MKTSKSTKIYYPQKSPPPPPPKLIQFGVCGPSMALQVSEVILNNYYKAEEYKNIEG